MKLLKKWWTGQHLTCRECGQEFELGEQDAPQSGFLTGHPYAAAVKCPSCDEWTRVRVPYGAAVPTVKEGDMPGVVVRPEDAHRALDERRMEELAARVESLEAAIVALVGRTWTGWEWTPRDHTSPMWRCSQCKAESEIGTETPPEHDPACPIRKARALLAGQGGA